jgi:hypothetical protein
MAQYKGQPKSRANNTFFLSFTIKTWSSKHKETSSDVRQPGVDQALCSLTGNSSGWLHTLPLSALRLPDTQRRHRPTPRLAALPTAASLLARQASPITTDKQNGILANTVTWRRLNKYHICCWYRDCYFTTYLRYLHNMNGKATS